MTPQFADRVQDVPRSFIREILKVALDPSIISFAGGLPNRDYFPVEALKSATQSAMNRYGSDLLQYGNSEGFPPLRDHIAQSYKTRFEIDVSPERVIVTAGSQQGLDLLGKILINEGDGVIIEEPGYLGAIQAFSIYRPHFFPVPVSDGGMNTTRLASILEKTTSHHPPKNSTRDYAGTPKIIYTVPNFQNPSGISYDRKNRRDVANAIEGYPIWLIEDDPYGELRFSGSPEPSFLNFAPDQTIALGSFSKTVVPGFRLGWIVVPESLVDKLVIAKQATDLHTSHFTQAIVHTFLTEHDVETHLEKVRDVYRRQCEAMKYSVSRHFPAEVGLTNPEGGMFLWATLPESIAALDLFEIALAERVVFVPGDPFYIDKQRLNTMRLNFSSVDEETIEIGISRLGRAIEKLAEGISATAR